MEFIRQNLDEILSCLSPLTVDWRDETADRIIARLRSLGIQKEYGREDLKAILDDSFEDGLLILRLFLGLSKDQFIATLKASIPDEAIGVSRYRANPGPLLDALEDLGVCQAAQERPAEDCGVSE